MSLRDNWLAAVDRKGSFLCAGVDPADYSMGRGEKGLPKGCGRRDWTMQYIHTIAPHCAAIKPNLQYWKNMGDDAFLLDMVALAHDLGMVYIEDAKLADISDTNEAGIFYTAKRADAVTFSPFAGNIEEAAGQAKKIGIGLISMVLMSNPGFKKEKMKLAPVDWGEIEFYPEQVTRDVVEIGDHIYIPQYIQLAHTADEFGVDGIVIGAPSPKNHITSEEVGKARVCVSDEMLVLVPGIGAQQGEAETIYKWFDPKNVIVNVGRGLMFPNGSNSTSEQQIDAAKHYRDMLNSIVG
ncbi:MAG: orotidine 5'-phosphate decarboxylase / HUMPS family protein [Candidatus Aenigmatarchaeota archaeon]